MSTGTSFRATIKHIYIWHFIASTTVFQYFIRKGFIALVGRTITEVSSGSKIFSLIFTIVAAAILSLLPSLSILSLLSLPPSGNSDNTFRFVKVLNKWLDQIFS